MFRAFLCLSGLVSLVSQFRVLTPEKFFKLLINI